MQLNVRKIAQLETLADILDRCVEMGKPAFYYQSWGAKFSDKSCIDAVASIDVLAHVAREAATKGINLIVSPMSGEMYPHDVETVREAYSAVGRMDQFNPDNIRYYSDYMTTWMAANYPLVDKERPAAIIGMGGVGDDIYYFTAYMVIHGIDHVAIAGSGAVSHVAYIIIGADEWLVGDEYYAAAIVLGGKGALSGSLITTDLFKLASIIVLILGLVITSLGSSFILDLLSV
jgi:hypothetical protein